MSDITTMMMAASGGVAGDYEISRSLRFNSADSAYLSRTPASAGNRKTWTWSGWVKRGTLGDQKIFQGGTGGTDATFMQLYFASNNALKVSLSTIDVLETTPVFRDVSSWYHIVFTVDTTNATANNRQRLYVNGEEITNFAIRNNLSLNTDYGVNNTQEHNLGRQPAGGYFNGYMADINFIDGQALTPSSFGETDETTGVWKPIRYAGTYGTNGFHLDFSDNTSTTTLGYDAAGSNDWTLNNFSVTAGAGNDSLVDSPTRYGTDTGAGGEVRGNYCTLNPLYVSANKTLSDGNLTIEMTSESDGSVATIQPVSGKWYWEVTVNVTSLGNTNIGVIKNVSNDEVNDTIRYRTNTGYIVVFNSTTQTGITAASNGDVVGIALNLDDDEISFYLNNTQLGVTASFSRNATDTIGPWCGNGNADTTKNLTFNFGQRPFAYTAPSGFKALCTTNLPDPTVVQGDDYFNTVLYTGTGSSLGVTGVGFQPDFTWIKERNGAADHGLYDAVRGVTKQLESSTTDAETTEATGLTAFGTDGFTVGALAQLNTNTDTYVAWNWKANGAGSSNTDGTISSTVSANTTAGISIVTYTGTGANATVGHGIGIAPSMIIIKNRTGSGVSSGWGVYHAGIGPTKYLALEQSAAAGTSSALWNDTAPTSTVFSLGNEQWVNTNGGSHVAYCFAEVEGFSKFGSFVANGSADGTFVYLGFRPALMLWKNASSVGSWNIFDTSRSPYNAVDEYLRPNTSDAEATGTAIVDLLSNGFKARVALTNGNTYIYMAFAENPFKNSLAR